MKQKISEEELKQKFIKYMENEGIKVIADEISHFGSIIDVVYIDKERRFCAVELKLTDWQGVIKQARILKRTLPCVYIAMPFCPTYTKRQKIEIACKQYEIGLYWYSYSQIDESKRWSCQLNSSDYIVSDGDVLIDTKYFSTHLERSLFVSLI